MNGDDDILSHHQCTGSTYSPNGISVVSRLDGFYHRDGHHHAAVPSLLCIRSTVQPLPLCSRLVARRDGFHINDGIVFVCSGSSRLYQFTCFPAIFYCADSEFSRGEPDRVYGILSLRWLPAAAPDGQTAVNRTATCSILSAACRRADHRWDAQQPCCWCRLQYSNCAWQSERRLSKSFAASGRSQSSKVGVYLSDEGLSGVPFSTSPSYCCD